MTTKARSGIAGAVLLLALSALLITFGGGQEASATPQRPNTTITVDAALGEAQTCMEDAGLDAVIEPGEGLRLASIRYSLPAGEAGAAPDPASSDAAADCLATHYDPVAEQYVLSRGEPSPAAVGMLFDAIEACVDEGGRPGTEVKSLSTVQYANTDRTIVINDDELSAFAECAQVIQSETGLLAPNPVVRN
jgi:hypothetical protein